MICTRRQRSNRSHERGSTMKRQFSTSAWQWLISTCVTSAATIVSSFAPVPAFAAQDCASLANLKIENTNLLSATEVPANGDLPAYCRVLGYVRPAINFEIRLPSQNWNGKFYMAGCGAFAALWRPMCRVSTMP